MRKVKKLRKKIKKLEIENKKLANEKKLYLTYANNWKNEYCELSERNFIKEKELLISKTDLILNRFYLAAAVGIAIIELIIIYFLI